MHKIEQITIDGYYIADDAISENDLAIAQIIAELLDADLAVQWRKNAIDLFRRDTEDYIGRFHWGNKSKWAELRGNKKFWATQQDKIAKYKAIPKGQGIYRFNLTEPSDLKDILEIFKAKG